MSDLNPKLPREIETMIFEQDLETYNSLVFLDNYTSNWIRESIDFYLLKVLNFGCFDKLEEILFITKEQIKDNFYRYIKGEKIDNFNMEFISWLIYTKNFENTSSNVFMQFLSEMKSGLEEVSYEDYEGEYVMSLYNILYYINCEKHMDIREEEDNNFGELTTHNLIRNTKNNPLWYLIKLWLSLIHI